MTIKQITSNRIILGILSELDACDSVIFCRSAQLASEPFTPSQMTLDPENQLIIFKNEVINNANEMHCEAVFYSKRIHFNIKKAHSKIAFSPPTLIETEDLRESKRFHLSSTKLNAEVSWASGILLGTAHDISSSFISINSQTRISNPDPLCTYTILVKSNSTNPDVYFSRGTLINAIETQQGIKLVFRLTSSTSENNESTKYIQRAPRHKISKSTITFHSHPDLPINLSGQILVHECSLTGFSGEFLSSTLTSLIPLGLVLRSNEPAMTFYPIRKNKNVFGFRIHTCDKNPQIHEWNQFVNKQTNSSELIDNITSSEIAELFTESTLLKSKRRCAYGSDMTQTLISESSLPSSLGLIRRFGALNKWSKITQHISTLRLFDNSWFLQEVSSASDSEEPIDGLAERILRQLANEYRFLRGTPRYISGIYDPSINKNSKLWGNRKNSLYLYATHKQIYNLNSFSNSAKSSILLNFESLDRITSKDKIKLNINFDSNLLDIIDFWSLGSNNRLLNEILSNLGSHHRSSLELVTAREDQRPIAILYRLQSHYTHNITGVANALYVFCIDQNLPLDQLLTETHQQKPHLITGTQDILFIQENDYYHKNCGDKYFKWFSIDLEHIPTENETT